MVDIFLKNFKNPDETRVFEKGKFELLKLPSMTIGRATYKPGWKWSEDVSPLSGTDFCEVEHLFNVPSAAFTPKPKVSSAIVRLTPHARREVEARSVEALQTVVRTAFNLRRKTLKNSLKAIMSAETLAQIPVSLSERPENLSLSDYVAISDLFAQELNQSHHD